MVVRRRYDKAIALYERARSQFPSGTCVSCSLSNPGPCSTEYAIAYVKARRGDLAESQAHFDAARRLFEAVGTQCTIPFAEFLILEAYVLAQRGYYDKALANC